MILIDHLLCHARSLSRPLFVMPSLSCRGTRHLFSLSCRGTRHLFFFVMPRYEASFPCHAEERGISSSLSCRAFFVMPRHEASFPCHAGERGISSSLSCRGTRHLSLPCHAEVRGISSSLSCRGTGILLSCRGTRHLFSLVMPSLLCHAEARGISSSLSCRGTRHLPCHPGAASLTKYPSDGSSHPVATSQISPHSKFKARIKRLYQIKLLISSPAFYFLLSCNSDIDILV